MISLAHDHADGTLVTGDPRPHQSILKAAGFRWSRNMGQWYFPRSRDRNADTVLLDRVAAQLRSKGLVVEIEIDNDPRDPAEREADRQARSQDRADHLEAKAARLSATADSTLDRAREMADVIPLGQPILVGHYSEGRDRNYRAKIGRTFERAFETADEARETARRAGAARATQAQHESLGTTLRRIEKLEAEGRDIDRKLQRHADEPVSDWNREHPVEVAAWVERITARREQITADVDHWRRHVADLEADGEKIWGPGDFVKGDRVLTPHEGTVLRVNAKSLTVEWDLMPGIRQTVKYSKVTGKAPAPVE